jgi:hypothetical protein
MNLGHMLLALGILGLGVFLVFWAERQRASHRADQEPPESETAAPVGSPLPFLPGPAGAESEAEPVRVERS